MLYFKILVGSCSLLAAVFVFANQTPVQSEYKKETITCQSNCTGCASCASTSHVQTSTCSNHCKGCASCTIKQ